MRQIDATIEAVIAVKPDFKKHHDKGNEIIVGDLRKRVCEIVLDGIIAGDVDYSKDVSDLKTMRNYVTSMVSNWLRRNKVLNGDSATTDKASGRNVINDEELDTLRELRKTQIEPEILAEIDKYINKRLSLLRKQSKVVKKEDINLDALPAHLRSKLNL